MYNKLYKTIIAQAADEFDMDPCLVHAMIQVESGWRADVQSHCGAAGLMQLIPETFVSMAQKLRIDAPDIWNPAHNVRCGAYYLRRQYDKFPTLRNKPERWKFALACYNCGPVYVQLALRLSEIRHGNKSDVWDITKKYLRHDECVVRGKRPYADQVIAYVDKVVKAWGEARALRIYSGIYAQHGHPGHNTPCP